MKLKSNKQGVCPFCGEYGTLSYGCAEFEDNLCYFPWVCANCGHEGEEWYSMEFDGHNVIDKDGNNVEIEDYMIERDDK